MHTHFSVDCLTQIPVLLGKAHAIGLDRIAITDHNCILGAQLAHELEPEFVIVGEEIRTEAGEVIAYFVQEEIPRGLSLEETLCRLESQGAVISIPHPLDRVRNSALGMMHTLEIIERVDALETLNSRCLWAVDNQRATELAKEYRKLITAGSDAHIPQEVGLCGMYMPPFTNTPESFRLALAQAQPYGRVGPYWTHLASKWAKYRKQWLPYDASAS